MKERILLLVMIFGVISSSAFAQDTTKKSETKVIPGDSIMNKLRNMPDYRGIKGDSTVIPKSRAKQQSAFLSGDETYPPKPRNMWEVGIGLGTAFIASDVPSQLGYGGELYVRKALGYVVSLRVEGVYAVEYGLDWKRQTGLQFNDVLNGNSGANLDYYHTTGYVYDNYYCQMENLNVNAVFALNNIGYHHPAKERKFIIDGIIGAAGLLYNTHINQLNASGNMYNYNSIPAGASKTQTISDLKSLQDNTYETEGDQSPGHAKIGSQWLDPGFNAGFDLQYHLSKHFSISAEFLLTAVHDDDLSGDGYQFNGSVARFSAYHHEFITLGYTIGKHSVEPLYWQNPSDYTYDALKTMRKGMADMLKDSDGDGVPDYLDQEPNTPAGQPVDAHGKALQLDKNGVPHYDVKGNYQPSTLVQSDLDSVNAQMGRLNKKMDQVAQDAANSQNWFLPMIFFDLNESNVKAEYYPELKYVATVMKAHPKLQIVITGNTDVRASENYNKKLSEKRAENTRDYLVKTYGIDAGRFVVKSNGKDDQLVPGLKSAYPYKENEQQVNRRVEFKVYDPKTD